MKISNKKDTIILEVLEDDQELKGIKLSLVKVCEGLYQCIDSNIEIVDALEELDSIDELSKNSEDNIFYALNIFSTSFGKTLKFIEEVKYLSFPIELNQLNK